MLSSTLPEEINLYFAKQAIAHVHKALPLGSSNRKVDEAKPTYGEALKNLESARKESMLLTTKNFWERIKKKVEIYKRYQAGNCEEQSYVALLFLGIHHINDVDMCKLKDGDHTFLIIGGNVICDPWENKAYHVREFKNHQAESPADYSSNELEVRRLQGETSAPKPYLFGKPHTIIKTCETQPPSAIEGEFTRATDFTEKSGDGKTITFSLLRFCFLSSLKKAGEVEAKVSSSVRLQELLHQSDEIIPIFNEHFVLR